MKYNSVPNYEVQYTKEFTSLVKAMRADLYGSGYYSRKGRFD